MGWSSGTFSRVHDWTSDEAGAIDIEAARMDQEDDNFETGINTCLTKDGQNSPTADLPMGSQKHTGVGNATARDQYVAVNQIQDGDLYVMGTVAGTNTVTGVMTPTITAYTNGMRVLFLPANANTGAATLNIDSVGAQSITKNGTTALAAGDLAAGVWADCVYDTANTNWILLNPQTISVNNSNWSGTDLSVANGGTGASTLTGLLQGNGTSAITGGATINNSNWSGTDLAVENGGTGASSASAARTALGVAIGSDVQAWDTNLDQVAALAVTDGNFIVGNGSAWVAESGATARTSLGLGSLATENTVNNSNWSGTDLSVANGGTGASTLTGLLQGNGTSAITGGATINNSNWSGTDLSVANGGTGASTLTGLLQGNGTSAITGGATINNGNWSGTDLAVTNGGTGASTAAGAATNLGLGTGDSPQFTGINVGHASDTTITRDAAGQIAVEGDAVFTHESGTYTSAKIHESTSSPSGGSDGDIWLEREA